VHYGYIKDGGTIIDEALVSVYRAPRSYTCEDVVEISAHGGFLPTRKILELCIKKGARLAEPGEFTKRAFLNGRIDITQAEAVCDIIYAKSERGLLLATAQLTGGLSEEVNNIKSSVLDLMSLIEASLNFPEEDDVEPVEPSYVSSELEKIKNRVSEFIKFTQQGKIYREGLYTAIVGKPNVGKSTIMNRLLRKERVIVTPIPGTTRDIIEDSITINGIAVVLFDTAGITETANNEIELIGIEKSKKLLKECDLVIFVIDGSQELTKEDAEIAEIVKEKNLIVAINKKDLPRRVGIGEVKALFPSNTEIDIVELSALNGDGIALLEDCIFRKAFIVDVAVENCKFLPNLRHYDIFLRIFSHVEAAIRVIGEKGGLEIVAIELRKILELLSEITGENFTEDILERIFSRFCIGK
jgi:tRNA modification GTPase